MNTFNHKNSGAASIKNQTTMRSRRGGLSRMGSKLSIATRKRRRRGGPDPKDINELKLNMKNALEDIRKLKNFEHDSLGTFRRFENTLVDLKRNDTNIMTQNRKLNSKQEVIQLEHSQAMKEASEQTEKVVKIYKDIQKMIGKFKTEYRYGFKKIIKSEVDINFLNQQLNFIKTKIKPKKEEKINKEKLLEEIDEKFEILYGQVSNMATEQAHFNLRIQNDQERLKEPLESELSKIRQESHIMMRELERTQNNNRRILRQKMNKSMY